MVILVVSTDTVDGALASANMATMAETMGLGVMYAGLFVKAVQMSRKLQKSLGLHKKEKAVAALAVGYPAVTYKRTVPRKKKAAEWR